MNENLETSIDGLSTSCSSCCLSQNIIESLKQRIEKLESIIFSGYNNLHKNSHLDENASNVKQMEEKIQFLTEKTRDQQILLQQNFQFQQMQLTIIENKKLNNNDVNPFKLLLDNQKEEKLEALSKENKLLKEKCEEIEKKDLEKFNENIKLNKQLEELNIEMTKIKEEHQLTLTELSKYKKECQDLEIKYSTEKSQNKRRARSIREEFNQMKLEIPILLIN
uniref:Uncharacterized protein n=1 Tax=Meloidogyne hapla TaxID=6305 RepID=A0A1I8B8E2_MELHA